MSSIDEIRDTRIKKLELLKKKGMDSYPADSKRELSLKEALLSFFDLEKSGEKKWIGGRVMSIRGQGAIIFITLDDGTANFQGLFKKDVLGNEKFNFFNETVDIGDFVEIFGKFFTTRRGEKTVETEDWRMLSKSLRPLPEKWHGLQDIEERYRKRYLDMIMNPEIRELFEKKAKFWDAIRNFLKERFNIEASEEHLLEIIGELVARDIAKENGNGWIKKKKDYFLTNVKIARSIKPKPRNIRPVGRGRWRITGICRKKPKIGALNGRGIANSRFWRSLFQFTNI